MSTRPDAARPDPPPADGLIAETEAWFLRRGIPHFINDYRATEDVFTRALPALVLILLLELVGAANLAWRWWVNLAVVLLAIAAVVGIWAGINRLRGRRWSQRPDTVGPVEIALFLVIPTTLPLVFGGQVGTAAVAFFGNVALLVVIYLVTSYGLIPMTRWAFVQTRQQLSTVLGLFGRALPLLLLFSVALFVNTEVWQVSAALEGFLFWATIGFFVSVGTIFLLLRLPTELARLREQLAGQALVDACQQSPLAGAARELEDPGLIVQVPLSRRQQGNILLVLLFTQAVQVVLVTLAISTFFFLFGLVAIRPEVVAAWLGDIEAGSLASWEVFGRELQVTRALFQVSGFLGALSGFYFTVYVITDATYRQEFFTEIVDEVRQSLAVRNVYLDLLNRR